jgi:hypothetical protein
MDQFNPPPNWPTPPPGWYPPPGWRPDPTWGPIPPGWQLFVRSTTDGASGNDVDALSVRLARLSHRVASDQRAQQLGQKAMEIAKDKRTKAALKAAGRLLAQAAVAEAFRRNGREVPTELRRALASGAANDDPRVGKVSLRSTSEALNDATDEVDEPTFSTHQPAVTPPHGLNEPSYGDPDGQWPYPAPASGTPADSQGLTPDVQSPFGAPEETVLRGPIDTANCGDFSFTLYTAQLIVSMLGTAGGVGGEYSVPTLRMHAWTRLIGRDRTPLPILVFRDHGSVALRVGNVPAGTLPSISATR